MFCFTAQKIVAAETIGFLSSITSADTTSFGETLSPLRSGLTVKVEDGN